MKHQLNNGLLKAQKHGLVVVEPKSNELQIDLDGARALRRYGMQFAILRRAGLTKGWKEKITPSRKRGHVHVTIKTDQRAVKNTAWPRSQFTILERIGLAAILGDDPARAAFNWCRAALGEKYPVVFFEEKKK
jgi:hypothetical protein